MKTDNITNNKQSENKEEAMNTEMSEKKPAISNFGIPIREYAQINKEAKVFLKEEVSKNYMHHFHPTYHNGLKKLVSEVTDNPAVVHNNYKNITYTLKTCWYCLHLTSNISSGVNAVYGIEIGKVLDVIQRELTEKGEMTFNDFLKEQGYKSRTVQRYVRLAKSPGIEDYTNFGIERLDFMLSAMERSNYRGTIKDFISTFGIDFDPLEDKIKSVNDFKIDVSTAILKYLNEKENWGIVDIKLLEKYAKNKKGSIDYRTIQEGIETVQESGGTPEKYFILMLKGGSEAKRFKLLIQNTSNAMDDILNNVDTLISSNKSIDMIGANKIDVLIEKLNTLKEGVQITQET